MNSIYFIIISIFVHLGLIKLEDQYYRESNESITTDKDLVAWTGIATFLYWHNNKVIDKITISNIRTNLQFQAAQAVAKHREFGIRAVAILEGKI